MPPHDEKNPKTNVLTAKYFDCFFLFLFRIAKHQWKNNYFIRAYATRVTPIRSTKRCRNIFVFYLRSVSTCMYTDELCSVLFDLSSKEHYYMSCVRCINRMFHTNRFRIEMKRDRIKIVQTINQIFMYLTRYWINKNNVPELTRALETHSQSAHTWDTWISKLQ